MLINGSTTTQRVRGRVRNQNSTLMGKAIGAKTNLNAIEGMLSRAWGRACHTLGPLHPKTVLLAVLAELGMDIVKGGLRGVDLMRESQEIDTVEHKATDRQAHAQLRKLAATNTPTRNPNVKEVPMEKESAGMKSKFRHYLKSQIVGRWDTEKHRKNVATDGNVSIVKTNPVTRVVRRAGCRGRTPRREHPAAKLPDVPSRTSLPPSCVPPRK